jgi:hypothetical protein
LSSAGKIRRWALATTWGSGRGTAPGAATVLPAAPLRSASLRGFSTALGRRHFRELFRGLVSQAAVRPHLIVIDPPCLDALPRFLQSYKPELIQALIPKLAVEALDPPAVGRLAGTDEVQGHAVLVRPLVHDL